MGLFNRKSKIKDERTFYSDCVTEFHNKALQFNQAKRGLIFIPELIQFGQDSILKYLQDAGLQSACGTPENYYFTVMVMALRTGFVYSATWHEDYSLLKTKVFYDVSTNGPSNYVGNIVSNDLKMTDEEFMNFVQCLFETWLELHKPYWDLQDPRKYTFNDLLAVYQLGISMELATLGY